jgi:Flp pilus assembly CpaF family ATPase
MRFSAVSDWRLKHTLRLDPDWIIIGEVRGREALDMVDGANSGHEGLLCTIHSTGSQMALRRLTRLCRRADPNFDHEEINMAVGGVLQIVLKNGERKIELWENHLAGEV